MRGKWTNKRDPCNSSEIGWKTENFVSRFGERKHDLVSQRRKKYDKTRKGTEEILGRATPRKVIKIDKVRT